LISRWVLDSAAVADGAVEEEARAYDEELQSRLMHPPSQSWFEWLGSFGFPYGYRGIPTCRELHHEDQSLDDPEMRRNVRIHASKVDRKTSEIHKYMSKGVEKTTYAMSNTRPPCDTTVLLRLHIIARKILHGYPKRNWHRRPFS
jgi:hypothetical protein